MNDARHVYLSLGSNIQAGRYLPQAAQLLRQFGRIAAVSSVWESESIGFAGPNFLNACVLFLCNLDPAALKEQIIRPIEATLGRVRSAEKNAPRPIDIDILLCDGKPLNVDFWSYPFVVIPLAELLPDFIHPSLGEPLSQTAARMQKETWMLRREDVRL